jgi:CubicO group peptidase (beta-lactamase class C family)
MKLSAPRARAGTFPPRARAYFLAALCAFSSHAPARAASVSGRVDAYVAARMAKHKIPGLAVAVVRGGRVLKLKGYGVASVEFGVAADEQTVFQLFSVSKVFAGVAALKLAEDGRLSLDAPVAELVEGLPPA